jgi:hypothetical protein
MSTFDTKMDLEEGLMTEEEAIVCYVHYLAMWCPEAAQQESFHELACLLRKKYPQYSHILDIQWLGLERRTYATQ